ncbi:MAG: zinc metallopeptidase, partial [Chloroflexota bacterium]
MFYMLFVLIPLLALAFAAQQYVDYVFYKWNQIDNSAHVTGMQAAERISHDANLGVALATIPKKLGDHYDPTTHT